MLILTLRALERDGMVSRTDYATIPPKVEYELTDLRRSLINPLGVQSDWAIEYQPIIEKAREDFDRAE
jgi:DNA-binding HxlR family transcriptional regulator